MGGVINPEPLYYNIQVSVDKDFIMDTDSYNVYADSPRIVEYKGFDNDRRGSYWGSVKFGILPAQQKDVVYFYSDEFDVFEIYNTKEYPIPNVIKVMHNGIEFTFTPIPVYEKL